MEVYYVNHKKETIRLDSHVCQMQVGTVFDSSWNYEGNKMKVSKIYKSNREITTEITISAQSEKEFDDAVNHFFEVIEADTEAGVAGKLFVGEYYLLCNIISNKKKFWEEMHRGMDCSITILKRQFFWYKEITRSFFKRGSEAVSEAVFLKYPYNYPFKYSSSKQDEIDNDHYASSDFLIRIYGPCENPEIRINGHLYKASVTLENRSYLEIDSRVKRITKTFNDGIKKNMFNSREKNSDIFKKIPVGKSWIQWEDAAFGFDLTLYQERGEPKWSS